MGKKIASAVCAAVLVALDQLLKHWATAALLPVGARPLWPGVIELRYVLNDGMAFSMLSGRRALLLFATGAILLAVGGWLMLGHPTALERAAWTLVLGGGIGNFIDRALNGQVVDYLNFQFIRFSVFNFADICVCTGVGLLVLSILLDLRRAPPAEGGPDAPA